MDCRFILLAGACVAVALTGCASDHRPGRPPAPQWHPAVDTLLHYDRNHDGAITRAELEAGLREDFARDDTNHDGRLEKDEVRAVNERRWARDSSAASPLVDWNQDGYVDFDEFSAGPRSLFDQLDTDGNGTLSPAELKTGRAGTRPESKAPRSKARPERRNGGGEPPGGDGDGD